LVAVEDNDDMSMVLPTDSISTVYRSIAKKVSCVDVFFVCANGVRKTERAYRNSSRNLRTSYGTDAVPLGQDILKAYWQEKSVALTVLSYTVLSSHITWSTYCAPYSVHFILQAPVAHSHSKIQ
jgi:hypothetical protein